MVELRYALTREDLSKFNFFHAWTDPSKRNTRSNTYLKYWARITLPTLVLVLIMKNGQFNLDAGRSYLVVVLIGLILALTTCQLAMKKQVQKLADAFANDPLNENFFKVKNYEFTLNGILVSEEYMLSDIKWNAIVRKAETDSAYYLFLNSHQAIVIPKRIIEESQKIQVDSIFNAQIPFSAEVPLAVRG